METPMAEQEPILESQNIPEAENVSQEQNEVQETPEQINWRLVRERTAEEKRKRIEAEERAAKLAAEAEAIKAAFESMVNKPSPSQSVHYPEHEEDSDERRMEKLIEAKLREREQQYAKERAEREKSELPNKLKQTYSDFEVVCSEENIEYLKYHYPEISRSFQYRPDDYESYSDLYKAIKRFVPNPDDGRDARKVEKNLAKPQSMSVAGRTSTTDSAPVMLDEAKKAANWRRMQEARRSV